MSFILDALKKLEHKRRQESVPDLTTNHSPEPRKSGKHSVIPYIVAAALILNAGILLTWLHPWDKKEPPLIAESDIVQPEKISAQQSVLKNTDSNLTPPPSPKIQKSADDQAGAAVINELPEPEPDTAEARQSDETINSPSHESPVANIDIETPEPTPEDNKLASLKINPSAGELATLRSKIKEEQLSSVDNPADELKPDGSGETGLPSEVLELSQLPSSVREGLPEIKISGHVFSNNPSSRIANINGDILREGDTVTSGLKVREITMTGIIFDYEGFRFRMRAF